MRIYWWQNGLHIEPESKEDYPRLQALMKIFETAKVGHVEPINPHPGPCGRDEEQSDAVRVSL